MRLLFPTFALAVAMAVVPELRAVIFLDSDDPAHNTSTPGDNSGWQFEGMFGGFLGTPVAPYYFLTAKHIGGSVGMPFVFHGETYTTTAVSGDPSTDLQLWQVDHPFPTYAPVYQPGTVETGQVLHVFGRGTRRGGEIDLDGTPRGWGWGPGDGVERWGCNVVSSIESEGDWHFLRAAFDSPGLPSEAHLSAGDSGGGIFILQDGLWRLAGINYGVDDLFTAPDPGTQFVAAIFDARGYYEQNDDGTFTLLDGPDNVPTSFYGTQISSRLEWIGSVIAGFDPGALPAEAYGDWQHAYFTPDQLADETVAGPGADPDGDGITNLLEFAFNLDPTFAETAVMTPGTGLRGLPLVRLETLGPSDQRLTVEFVRRTAGGGSGITYAVQFTTSLAPADVDWETGGAESVTAINARWERVKVTDTVSVGGAAPGRFARVLVAPAPPAADPSRARATRRRPGAGLRAPGAPRPRWSRRRAPSPPRPPGSRDNPWRGPGR